MSEPEATPTQQEPPPCDRCGVRTFPSKRKMRSHDISSGKAVPKDALYAVWRCPKCGLEMPRSR